jgi:hypothetical protein
VTVTVVPLATVVMPMVAFVSVITFAVIVSVITFAVIVSVITFAVIVSVITFAVIVPVVTFVFVTRRFLFVPRRFFLRMATTPTCAKTVFAVVVLVPARAFSAAKSEIATAGDCNRAAGTDGEHRSRKDCRQT